jgi:hypothetical protein
MKPRRGSALVTALLALLLLEAAIAGLLFACTQEALIARAHTGRLRHRLAAESAIDAIIAAWPADSVRALAPGGIHRPAMSDSFPGGAVAFGEIERLRSGWFVLRGFGGARGAPSSARATALVSTFDEDPLWRQFSAPVIGGASIEIGAGTRVDGAAADAIPPPWSAADCPAQRLVPPLAAFAGLVRPAVIVSPAVTPTLDPGAALAGTPVVAPDSTLAVPATFQRFGAAAFDAAAALADRTAAGSIAPRPASIGTGCDTAAAGNFGAPLDPAHPCAAFFPLVHAPADLEFAGGQAQGIVLARGNVRLAATVFAGVILAGGAVTIDDATVLGSVMAAGGVRVLGPSVVSWNACALWRAFTLPPPLRRPLRLGPRWVLPVG